MEEASASSSQSNVKPESSGLNLRSRNKEWSGLTEAQSKLSRLQSMSETFKYTQEALLSLAREMTSKLPQSSKILFEINELKSKLSSQNQVDDHFLPKTSVSRSSYKLDRIDLISTKDQDEKINIRFPDNSQLNLRISKFQSKDSIFKEISAQFKDIGLKVERDENRKLIFTGPDKIMDSAWIFQGQGVRIPAGNPVPIVLKQLPDPLSDLSAKVISEDADAAREKLREILKDLSKKISVVDKETSNLLTKNLSLSEGKSSAIFDQSTDLKEQLMSNDNRYVRIQALISQANVPRDHVVEILSLE